MKSLINNKNFVFISRVSVIILFICFMFLRRSGVFEIIAENSIIPAILLALGIGVFFLQLMQRKTLPNAGHVSLLLLFLLSYVISSALNMRYGIIDNIKTFAFIVTQILLLYCPDNHHDIKKLKLEMNIVNHIICSFMFLFSLIAFTTYVLDIQILTWVKNTDNTIPQGYYDVYNRVWGIFYEANFLGVLCLLTVIISFYYVFKTKRVLLRILYFINIILQFFVIVLTGSRSTFVAMLVTACVAGWYFSKTFIQKLNLNALKTELTRVICGIAAFTLFLVLYSTVQFSLPYVRKAIINSPVIDLRDDVTSIMTKGYDLNGIRYEVLKKDITGNKNNNQPSQITRLDLVEDDDVSNGRLSLWKDALSIFAKRPVLGVSPRNINSFSESNNPDTEMAETGISLHSGYMQVLVGCGIIGFCILICFLLLCAKKILVYQNTVHRHFSDVGYLLCCITTLLTFIFFFEDIFLHFTIISVLFWLFLGYGIFLILHDDKYDTEREGFCVIANTPFQVFNAVNFVSNNVESSAGISDLILYHQFKGSKQVAERIRETKIFRKVYEADPYKDDRPRYVKLRTFFRLVFPRVVLKKHMHNISFLKNNYAYMCYSSNTMFVMNMRTMFPYSKIIALDDGIGSYFGNIHTDMASTLLKFFKRFVLNKDLDEPVQSLYVCTPQLCESTMTNNVLPMPSLNEEQIKHLQQIFDYKDNTDYRDNRFIYLTQPLSERTTYIDGSEQQIMQFLNEISSDKLLVRVHPRQKDTSYRNFNLDTHNNLWELECISSINDSHVLIGAFSTAQFSPKLIYNTEPYLIFTHKILATGWDNADEMIDKIKTIYSDQNKIFVPRSEDELEKIIKDIS